MRTFLLTLHVAGVAAWLGANLVQMILAPRFAKAGPELAAAWTRQTIWMGERYYTVAGAWTAVTGVLLVLDGDWSWSSGFIWVGVTVVVIGAVLGAAHFNPQARARVAALEAGDTATADRALAKIIPVGILDTVLILTAVLAMVDKWAA